MEPIMLAWADTSSMINSASFRDENGQPLRITFHGMTPGTPEHSMWVKRYVVLEKFYGQHLNAYVGLDDPIRENLGEQEFAGAPGPGRMSHVRGLWGSISEVTYQSLFIQALSSPLIRMLTTQAAENVAEVVSVDTAAVDALIAQQLREQPAQGLASLIALVKRAGLDLTRLGWQGVHTLQQYLFSLPPTPGPELQAVLDEFHVVRTEGGRFLIPGMTRINADHWGRYGLEATPAVLMDRLGDDLVLGSAGEERIWTSKGDDILIGGVGVDHFFGEDGHDWMEGGRGSDSLQGDAGNDVLIGGEGDDVLFGLGGSDTYIFSGSFGADQIIEDQEGANDIDLVRLIDLLPSQVEVRRVADDLVLTVHERAESIVITDYFTWDAAGGNAIERIEFSDGTVWKIEVVKSLVLNANASDQTLIGYATDDNIVGGDGRDLIRGNGGADTLSGERGVGDELRGGEGNESVLNKSQAPDFVGNF